MKDSGAFFRHQTGQFQFLERGSGHGRNLRPMFDDLGCESAGFTDFAIGGVVFELQREEFEGQSVERQILKFGGQRFVAALTDWGIDEAMPSKRNGLAQTRGEF